MAKDNSGLGSCLVVVGNPGGELAQAAASLACAAGIDAVACDDVYAAVTQIAKAADRRILIAGRIQDLAREKGIVLPDRGRPRGALLLSARQGRPGRRTGTPSRSFSFGAPNRKICWRPCTPAPRS